MFGGNGAFMDKFSKKAGNALQNAQNIACALGHTYIGSEHLLLGILKESESVGSRILLSRGITYDKVRSRLCELVGTGSKTLLSAADMTSRTRRIIEQSMRRKISGTTTSAPNTYCLRLRRKTSASACRFFQSSDRILKHCLPLSVKSSVFTS